MPRDAQLEQLRRMASRGMAGGLFWGCVVGGLVCLMAGVWSGKPPYFMVAIFLGVVALAARQTGPHVLRAAQAIDSALRSPVTVTVEVTQWTDSPTYHATVSLPQGHPWRMEFHPQGWTPEPGPLQATAHFVSGVPWPALLVADQGIIFPRYTPKEVAE